MGKPTGFLEYARQGNHCQPPLERVAYWNEFHPRLGREERQRQGARCMACGVPFCQSGAVLNGMVSGCPLHNLVPEWNDLVYRRKLGRALERLLKTNDFPEFTGRVCPALCEAACTCGLNGQPVTVKDSWGSSRRPGSRDSCPLGRLRPAPVGPWRWWAPAPPGSPALKGLTAEVTASPCSSGPTDLAAC